MGQRVDLEGNCNHGDLTSDQRDELPREQPAKRRRFAEWADVDGEPAQPGSHQRRPEPLSGIGLTVSCLLMHAADATLREAERMLIEERRPIDRALAARVAAVPRESLPDLFALAHRVRVARMGEAVEVESIISAKTGGCPEDCVFCSQSARYHTDVSREPMLATGQLVELARQTRELGGTEFCIVVAVRGPDERMMRALVAATHAIRDSVDIEVAASLGLLKDGQAERLAEAGVHRYNHNLEAA